MGVKIFNLAPWGDKGLEQLEHLWGGGFEHFNQAVRSFHRKIMGLYGTLGGGLSTLGDWKSWSE